MVSFRNIFLSVINRLGQAIPKKIQRHIADFPGVLGLFERLSHGGLTEIRTPEGHRLALNQLFHSNLIRSGDLGEYEPEIRNSILKLTKPGMAAYDIGANIGIFSFLFSSIVKKDGIVYAFEPEKNNFICFEKSLEINAINNIFLDKRAVGKNKGLEKFDRRGGAFSGRLVGEDAAYSQTSNIEFIDTINIDHLVKEEGFRCPDIMKIDVEGNEAMVLEGMKNILNTYNPIIICELHTHLGESSEHIINFLSSYDYSISGIKEICAEINDGSKQRDMSMERHIVAVKQ